MKEPLLISACLLGVACRYDGASRPLDAQTLEKLRARYALIPVCPEILTGTDTDPRYVYAIDKVMWDAYRNSNGQTPLPELVRASSIPKDELFMYELIAEDI